MTDIQRMFALERVAEAARELVAYVDDVAQPGEDEVTACLVDELRTALVALRREANTPCSCWWCLHPEVRA